MLRYLLPASQFCSAPVACLPVGRCHSIVGFALCWTDLILLSFPKYRNRSSLRRRRPSYRCLFISCSNILFESPHSSFHHSSCSIVFNSIRVRSRYAVLPGQAQQKLNSYYRAGLIKIIFAIHQSPLSIPQSLSSFCS